MDLFRLDGRVVLVSGGSRNIGAAMARGLADAGADLFLVARGADRLAAVAAGIRESTGRRVETYAGDIAVDAVRIGEAALEAFGDVHVLVNSAFSFGARGPILSLSDDAWQQAIDVNLLAPIRLSRVIGRQMVARGDGTIVNVLSDAGFAPVPTLGPYSVTKAALWMLTRSLAKELAPAVRVNALCPGTMTESGAARSEAQRRLTPMARAARADEVIGAALFLASDASSFSTGDVVYVNGGMTSLAGIPMEVVQADPLYQSRSTRDNR